MTTTNRYANAKVYRLVNSVDDEEYVGSTCDALHKRLYGHKKTARRKPQPVHHHLNKIGWDNVSVVLIEEYACENKMELERRERYWIEELKPSLNRVIPTRTRKEYYQDTAEKQKELSKKWKQDNREADNARDSKYRKERRANDDNYRQAVNANHREWYAKNKEAIQARRRQKKAEKQANQANQS